MGKAGHNNASRNRPITAAMLSATLMQTLKAFLKDDSGATAIKYGLVAAGSPCQRSRHQTQIDVRVDLNRIKMVGSA